MGILGRRLVAFNVDWIVLFAVFVAPQGIIALLAGDWFLDADSSNVLTWAWVGLSVTLPSLAYFVVCDWSPRGMTIGKRAMKLSVRTMDGNRLSLGQSVIRNIVKLIPWEATHIMIFFPEPFGDELSAGKVALMTLSNVLLLVWLLVPILDRQHHRAAHDRVANTRVIRDGRVRRPVMWCVNRFRSARPVAKR